MTIEQNKDLILEIERLSQVNQLILNSVAEGIYGIDLDAKVIFWNKSAEMLTGYKMEDFEHHNLHDLIHHTNMAGEHVPVVDCPVYHALKNGTDLFVTDDIFWRKDGTSFPVEYTSKPMIEDGKQVGTVITFRDITEKKKTEELILQWEKLSMVGQMAAGVAHEIRNPLTSLKGFLQLMKSNRAFNDQYFDIMNMEFDRIETIIKELLVFSKPQKSNYNYTNIKYILDQVILLMEPQAIIKNVTLTLEIETTTLSIYCIEHQLKQVFINLIKNGIEAIEDGGEILVRVIKQETEVIIYVKDNGVGMSTEQLSNIGTPFLTTKPNGTGLGMMVTNNIIKNHHKGSIYIESKPNQGTAFHIHLPIHPDIEF